MRLLGRGWRVAYAVMVVMLGLSLAGAAAAQPAGKGKPGGGGGGMSCPTGTAQVVLDPGHGGDDPGAMANGIVEAELNLDIAQRVANTLPYSVALTRNDNGTTIGNSERGDIANACGALVFVEIHFNAGDPGTNFTQTFWGKRRKDEAFAGHMNGYMNALGIPNNGVGQFANGGLLAATMPSTLIECSFITNPDEAYLLTVDESRKNQIAQAIADGIVAWIG
jgi:N-acetylmuramoyl-L-alanine amidase